MSVVDESGDRARLPWENAMDFKKVRFHGEFRRYQAKVLENIEKHVKDKKIHIVAAPGSGKTILGLELIRYFDEPTLILSPTITIREQWGQRFEESFLDEGERVEDYFSIDLAHPKLITCVTYQAVHAALNKTILMDDEDDETMGLENVDQVVKIDFDLFSMMKKAKIKTICLDEAHHLRSEWQKSLEILIGKLKNDAMIIALTATPPYDSTPSEWAKYIAVCGEIDDEISTPLLVAQGTLCPHQDYVYFNYPTEQELKVLSDYSHHVDACLQEIIEGDLLSRLIKASGIFESNPLIDELILDSPKGFISLLVLLEFSGTSIPKSLVRLVSPNGKLPKFTYDFAENALNFVTENPLLFTEENSEEISRIVAKHGLLERKKVRLVTNEKIKRMILSSVGKLASVSSIVEFEEEAMGPSLRMLILTDYIKRPQLSTINTNQPLNSIGIVTIFETLRRNLNIRLNLGVLSGTLVIVPDSTLAGIKELAMDMSIGYVVSPIRDSGYSELAFSGNNKQKVALMSEVFQKGLIQILIGTKSLLGEGWDSPSINSLILASFVGTFMLSNQMRGRAIRSDRNDPQKTANIWHLVTIEPQRYVSDLLLKKAVVPFITQNNAEGADYELLERRFQTFYAPSFDGRTIENGIQRLSIIKPPFNQRNIQQINSKMIDHAKDRSAMANLWKGILNDQSNPEIISESEIPKQSVPTSFLFVNALNLSMIALMTQIAVRPFLSIGSETNNLPFFLVGLLVLFAFVLFAGRIVVNLSRMLSPVKTIRMLGDCILGTLIDLGEVTSRKARFVIKADKESVNIHCALINATTYEKNIFAQAMSELLSSIENPRYVFIKQSFLFGIPFRNVSQSYACPTIISSKKEDVEILSDHLQRKTGKFHIQYTRSEKGRKILLRCRKKSYINRNEVFIRGKKKVLSKWE